MLDGFENERLVVFDCGQAGRWYVLARCPECCRFLKHGNVFANDERARCANWICKVHGEVQPIDSGWYGE